MINVGDQVICVNPIADGWGHYGVKKNQKFIVSGIVSCCGRTNIDIGLPFKRSCPSPSCVHCHKQHYVDRPHYDLINFRKIEPQYKVVEVSETIKEQRKDLILQ